MVARVSNCKKWCLAGLLGMIRQAAAAGNVTIFNLGEDFQPFKYSFMMTVVLAGLLVFDELVVEKIEHHLRHTSIFHVDLFNKTLKELMILGLISFSLFIIKDNTLVEDGSTFYNPSAIEFVKLFLFFMGVSFVLAAMALARFTGPIKERYDKYANTKLEVLVKKHNNMVEKTWWYYTTHPFTYFRELHTAQVIEYHLFRSVFHRLQRSILTPAFDFSRYTNEVVNKQIVKSFDFGWKSWLLSIILVFLTLLFIPHTGNVQVSFLGMVLFGLVMFLLEMLCFTYMHHAHSRLRASMGVEGGFKGVDKALKELWVEPLHHLGRDTTEVDISELQDNIEARDTHISSSRSGNRVGSIGLGSHHGGGSVLSSGRSGSFPSIHGGAYNSSRQSSIANIVKQAAPFHQGSTTTGSSLGSGQQADCNLAACSAASSNAYMLSWVGPTGLWLPDFLRGWSIKFGSHETFRTLFGLCMLLKCYYISFYFSYAIGRGIEDGSVTGIILWVFVTPLPLLICLLPLSKRTIPLYALLSTIKSDLMLDILADIKHRQEEAEEMRQRVLVLLHDALQSKMDQALTEAGDNNDQGMHLLRMRLQSESISPRTAAVEHWFAEWDTNKDNVISRKELEKGLKGINLILGERMLRELLRLADPDHSKSIDLEEFKLFLSDIKNLEEIGDKEGIRRTLERRATQRDVMMRSQSMAAENLFVDSVTTSRTPDVQDPAPGGSKGQPGPAAVQGESSAV